MAGHVLYENFVLENKLEDLLITKLDVMNMMTIDRDLETEAGHKKRINVYTYTGAVEKVAKGAKNTVRGNVSHTPVEYVVGYKQQTFDYFDEDANQDPKVVDMAMKGSSQVMINDMTTDYFSELKKATLEVVAPALNYDAVVDAVALMELEEENGLFLIINTSDKAEVRKDPDFKASKQGEILYKGQIGEINGIPVVVSKAIEVPTVATKEAVTCFLKKESEVEQDRNIEERKNTVVLRKINLVALTNTTKAVKIVKAASK